MKIQDLFEELSASTMRTKLANVFKEMGFKQSGVETTPGACKVWMDWKGPGKMPDFKETMKKAAKKLPGMGWKYHKSDISYIPDRVRGNGFEIEPQDESNESEGLFIACHRKGLKGQEYEGGIDT